MASASDLRIQLQNAFEAAAHQHLTPTRFMMFGGLPGGPNMDDGVTMDNSAFAPFMVQSDEKKHNETTNMRQLMRLAEHTPFWAYTHGRVGAEKMRDQEEESDTAVKLIPNHMWRIGISKSNYEQLLAWEGIDWKEVNETELAKLWAHLYYQGYLTTILSGHLPNNHRANDTSYPYAQHPNTYYGYDGAFGFGTTLDNINDTDHPGTYHMPNKSLAMRINKHADDLNLPYVEMHGQQYRCVCFLDDNLFYYLQDQLDEKFYLHNAKGHQDSEWFAKAVDHFVYRSVLFVKTGMSPFLALDWDDMANQTNGSGATAYKTLNVTVQQLAAAAFDISANVGGATNFNYALVLGGGAVRGNNGSAMVEKTDAYQDYEFEDASFVGRVVGAARADLEPTDGSSTYNDTSFVVLLRNEEVEVS